MGSGDLRSKLVAAAVTAAVLGIGMLVLQRWVAETRGAAIAMVVAWFAIVLVGLLVALRGRPELRLPALGTFVAILVGTVAIGYWTGFRDNEVDEDVAVAQVQASGAEREAALAGGGGGGDEPAQKPDKPTGPVELASGGFAGVDGHAGTGKATIVEEPGGERVLTFTDFDVDPGANVDVYLSASPSDVSDRIVLGDLKGNVGNQQYEIPADADLGRYPNVVLYCIPFSVRIAVAETNA
jgi:Electron transfer DM13